MTRTEIEAAFTAAAQAAHRQAGRDFPGWGKQHQAAWDAADAAQPPDDWLSQVLTDLEADQQHANEPAPVEPTAGVMPRRAIYHPRQRRGEFLA